MGGCYDSPHNAVEGWHSGAGHTEELPSGLVIEETVGLWLNMHLGSPVSIAGLILP